jgi:hypothetical protein
MLLASVFLKILDLSIIQIQLIKLLANKNIDRIFTLNK